MNWSRFVIAGVAGFIVLFGLGFAWHVPIFGGFYAEQIFRIARPEMILPTIIIAEIIRAFILAYIYPIGYKGGSPVTEGAKFGIMLGLFTAMMPLIYFARYEYASMAFFWVEGAFFVIQGAIAGIVIALIYGRKSADSA